MIRTVKKPIGLSGKLTRASHMYQTVSRALINSIAYLPSNDKYNITICQKPKFVWFRVAKVGTRTIFNVLHQAKLDLDAEHAMSCHYPANLYKNYFRFGFVRNPWDRLVSCWQNKVLETNLFEFPEDQLTQMQSFENFVDFVAGQNIAFCNPHIRLQSKLIDLNNVDFIGRFENFEQDLSRVIRILGMEGVQIGQKNASTSRSSYRAYYDTALREKVADIYRRDINLFHYEF